MEKSARRFNCTHCHTQVIICSSCDRGNVYCGPRCSQQSRVINHRVANQIYQNTFKGRQKHAERQRRYRQRQAHKTEKVTDQGSPDFTTNDLLPTVPNEGKSQEPGLLYCYFCKQSVSTFLRNGFLRHHQEDKSSVFPSWPLGP